MGGEGAVSYAGWKEGWVWEEVNKRTGGFGDGGSDEDGKGTNKKEPSGRRSRGTNISSKKVVRTGKGLIGIGIAC